MWNAEVYLCVWGGSGQNRATQSSKWKGSSPPLPHTHKPLIDPSTSPTKSLPGAGCGDKICGIRSKKEWISTSASDGGSAVEWIVGCTVPFSSFLCEETAISCCFNSMKHFWANHFQEVIDIPISLPFVQNSNLSGQKHMPEILVCVRLVRHFNISNSVIPLFRYSAIPLFCYSVFRVLVMPV